MTSWTSRVHRRAETMRQAVTNCGHSHDPYPKRFEKVKFGVPLDQVCKTDIPAPLLVLILKINKQGPYKKDVFRAPGHQGNIKKLTHFLQTGRLVNIEHYSVYTIASVLKKFLRKLPGGIFGEQAEDRLFEIVQLSDPNEQRLQAHRLIQGLSVPVQRLLVLLFGTFRVIAMHAENGGVSGMSSEALGVSVAPSFFMSCAGPTTKQISVEDIQRYKMASKIITFLIDNFALGDLFGRENYEYYAKITGRVLRVDDDWIFAFNYPHERLQLATLRINQNRLAHKQSYLQLEALKWGMAMNNEYFSGSDEALGISSDPEGQAVLPKIVTSASDHGSFGQHSSVGPAAYVEKWDVTSVSDGPSTGFAELKEVNNHAEATRSLSFLPIVHERQVARMRTRSEWFLAPVQRSLYDLDIEQSCTSVPTSSCDDRLLNDRSSISCSSHDTSRDNRESPLMSRYATDLSTRTRASWASETERYHPLTLRSKSPSS
ncbi:hypothetical protein RvY_09366 [Ramazzottius varieornatus]|uniref:Rho-GAP domain-containing protein n=1 Tax=Ramazzottius varieornatus TaxID=947166 RepID=A0A1D1VEK6_RAMVA|nr:hypothetical protein RvY_09366 [Ramazzottius varieornatus]